jgi:ATP-dependent RNA helicase RhlE
MKHFSELSLCSRLQSNLAKQGFVQTTPVQAQAIPPALAGQDVVATAQTGTGKTLAFLLPLLQSLSGGRGKGGIKALILSPTRELAIQTHESFTQVADGMGIHAALAVGGMSESHQLRAVRQGAQVLIATPGRLCDFLDRRLVNLGGVQFFVLDEADRMLDMGFLPSLRIILKAVPASRQTLLFSATIEKSVAHLVDAHVRNPVRVAIGPPTKPVDLVSLHVYEVETDRKLSLLTSLIGREPGTFLVFARTKHGTDRLAKNLARNGVKAARIHGGRTQNQRNQALNGFKDGQYRILVATDVAARGIHVEGIAHVVNYDLPQVPEDFIHRVGRTGRAGARGTASTFSTRGERGEIRRIERTLNVRLTPREVAEPGHRRVVGG